VVSIRASLTQFYLRHSKYKKLFSGEGNTKVSMQKLHAIPAALPSSRMKRKYDVLEEEYMGQIIYSISPKNFEPSNGDIDTILYLHGGGYVGAISIFHWHFIGRLIDTLGVRVVVPFYPRAPDNDVDANFGFMMPFYDNLIERYDPKKLAVMGDSAGAGLSLALSQQLIEKCKPTPAKIILLSPWLDVRGNDPRQVTIEKYDCILGVAGLQAAGLAYAGNNSLTNHRVSPILGSLSELPPIAMFAGTHDILITNAHDFKERIETSDTLIQLAYYEYEKMHHVWMLVPCVEASKCLNEIKIFIRA